MSTKKLAVIALIIASVIWGAAPPVFKWSLTNIPLYSLAFVRFALAPLILIPFIVGKLTFSKEDFRDLFLASFSGITLNILFFFWGLKLTSSINSAVISTAVPVFTIIGAVLFLHERPKMKVWIGTTVGFLGILVIVAESLLVNGMGSDILGNLFLVAATIAWAYNTIILKKLFKKYEAVTITFYSFIIGAITFLPFAIMDFVENPMWISQLKLPGIVGIVFGVILSSAAAYLLWDWGLSKMEASETGVFIYIDPIVAVLIAVPLLGERISVPYLIGSGLVFLGIFIVEGRIAYHPVHKLRNHSFEEPPKELKTL